MIYPGFIGSSYRTRSGAFSGDRLVNAYLEPGETGETKSPAMLIGLPGTTPFVLLPTLPVRALWEQNGRALAIGGNKLYELFTAGTAIERGTVANPGGDAPAQMESNPLGQVLIRSGQSGYIYELGSNTLIQLAGWLNGVGASGIAMVDTYFLAAESGTSRFYWSDLADGLVWPADQVATKEGWGDHLITLFADHRELWLFGEQTGEVWWNTGELDLPFQRLQGAFIEAGCAAARSVAKADNTILWLSKSERGQGLIWRANGYTPQRVSNFGVEAFTAIPAVYPTISDARAFTWEFGGHSFYRITFPAANATWELDIATGQWHECEWWDSVHATSNAVRGRCHCFAFGKHLVGDFQTGVICALDPEVWTDYGPDDETGALRMIRRAPHVYVENKRNTFHKLELGCQKGLVPSIGQGSDPKAVLRTSPDGGNTWSAEQQAAVGKIGEYDQRVFWTQLGQARDFVAEITQTDPAPRVWTEASLEMTRGLS